MLFFALYLIWNCIILTPSVDLKQVDAFHDVLLAFLYDFRLLLFGIYVFVYFGSCEKTSNLTYSSYGLITDFL